MPPRAASGARRARAARAHLPPACRPLLLHGGAGLRPPARIVPSEQRSRGRCGSYICAPGRTMQGRPRCPGSMFPAPGAWLAGAVLGGPDRRPRGLAAAGGSGLRAEWEVRAPAAAARAAQCECGLDRCASDRAESHVTARWGPRDRLHSFGPKAEGGGSSATVPLWQIPAQPARRWVQSKRMA